MYLFFKEYMPKTFLLSHFFKEYDSLSKKISNNLVIKPINWNSWKWIEFITKEELQKQKKRYFDISRMFIVQEYKDFSNWYNDIIKWIHDVRLVYVWWNFSFSIVRMPQKWKLKSNIWSWWKQFSLDYKDIPNELLSIANNIMQKDVLNKKDSLLSLDFAYSKNEWKWYLLEINCSPWIWFPSEDKDYQIKYFNDLWDLFIKNII